jgi:hypothetical protein
MPNAECSLFAIVSTTHRIEHWALGMEATRYRPGGCSL